MTRNNDRTQDAEATDNELEIIKVDADEAIKLAEAARTMLAALTAIANDPDTPADLRGMAFAVIAQAEAAGIKEG
jgi:uncharacterized protein (UPF0147 family)